MMILPQKALTETAAVTFRYAGLFPAGVTILSAAVTVYVLRGIDPTPAAILSGGAAINGTDVVQLAQGGVDGVYYVLECRAVGSDGQAVVLQAELPVVKYLI